MELLKNHYEKIILSVVLLGVIIFAVLLLARVDEERRKLDDFRRQITSGLPKPVVAVDLTAPLELLKKAQQPPPVVLSGPHNLFNPVKWVKNPNGTTTKHDDPDKIFRAFGVGAIRPLHFWIVFDGPTGPTESLRYRFTITDEGATASGGRKPVIRTLAAKANEKTRLDARNELAIREIRGAVPTPTELVMELTGDKELVTLGVGKEKGYRRLVGYEADAKYESENKVFKSLRLGSPLQFNNENYKVIAIDQSTVTIESISNQQRYIAPLTAAP